MIKTATIHDNTTSVNAITDGIIKIGIATAELDDASGNTVTWKITTPGVADMIITDAWIDLITPFDLSSLTIASGDNGGDDVFLLPIEIGAGAVSGRKGLAASSKGQGLADHRTALVNGDLTVTLSAGSALSSATGEAHLFLSFREVKRAEFAESTFSTTGIPSAGSAGAPSVPGSSFSVSDGINTDALGISDTLTFSGGNSATAVVLNSSTNTVTVTASPTAFTVTDGTTTETITEGSTLSFAGGTNMTTSLSSGVVTFASAPGAGFTASDGTTTKTVAEGDTFTFSGDSSIDAVFDTASTNLVISQKLITSTYIQMQTGGTGTIALDQDVKSYSPTDRPLYHVYEIDVTTLSGTDYSSILRFPDPGDYSKGTVFTIKNVSYAETAPTGNYSSVVAEAAKEQLLEMKLVRVLPESNSSSWVGHTSIDGHYLQNSTTAFPGFLLPRGASVTLTRLETGASPSSGFSTRTPSWSVTAHYDPREYAGETHADITGLVGAAGI